MFRLEGLARGVSPAQFRSLDRDAVHFAGVQLVQEVAEVDLDGGLPPGIEQVEHEHHRHKEQEQQRQIFVKGIHRIGTSMKAMHG